MLVAICTMIKCLYLVSLETWHPHREEVHRQTVNEIMQHPMNGTSVIASKENHEVMCVSVCIIMSVYVCVCVCVIIPLMFYGVVEEKRVASML